MHFIDTSAVGCGKKTFRKIKKPIKRRWPHAVHLTNGGKPCVRLILLEKPDFLSKTGQRRPFKRCPSTGNKIFQHYSLGLTPSPGGASFLLATSAMTCVSDVSYVNYGRPTEHHQRRLSRAIRVRDVVPLAGGTANYHVQRAGRAHARRLPIRRNGTKKKTEIQ